MSWLDTITEEEYDKWVASDEYNAIYAAGEDSFYPQTGCKCDYKEGTKEFDAFYDGWSWSKYLYKGGIL